MLMLDATATTTTIATNCLHFSLFCSPLVTDSEGRCIGNRCHFLLWLGSMLRFMTRQLTRLIPWKGHHIQPRDVKSTLLPWGFLSQSQIQQLVHPMRDALNKREVELNTEEDVHIHTVLYGDQRTNPMIEEISRNLSNEGFQEGACQVRGRMEG